MSSCTVNSTLPCTTASQAPLQLRNVSALEHNSRLSVTKVVHLLSERPNSSVKLLLEEDCQVGRIRPWVLDCVETRRRELRDSTLARLNNGACDNVRRSAVVNNRCKGAIRKFQRLNRGMDNPTTPLNSKVRLRPNSARSTQSTGNDACVMPIQDFFVFSGSRLQPVSLCCSQSWCEW